MCFFGVLPLRLALLAQGQDDGKKLATTKDKTEAGPPPAAKDDSKNVNAKSKSLKQPQQSKAKADEHL
jgi:hypothetical protein